MSLPRSVAVLGGTGKEGKGLAARWSRAGIEVVIGSREASRAEAAAAEVKALAGGAVAGMTNPAAAAAGDVVVLAMPYEGLEATLAACRDALGGKLVVSAVIPLRFDEHGPSILDVPGGSAAAAAAALLPASRVGAAFQTISAPNLLDLAHALDEDVPVAADDARDRAAIVELCAALGARGVEVGPLRLARHLEGLTAVIVSLNRLRKTRAGMRFTGLPAS